VDDFFRFVVASGDMVLADEAARAIGSSEVLRAMRAAIDHARHLVPLTDVAIARPATHGFITADQLAGAAFTGHDALVA
jgi:hypothetical protein